MSQACLDLPDASDADTEESEGGEQTTQPRRDCAPGFQQALFRQKTLMVLTVPLYVSSLSQMTRSKCRAAPMGLLLCTAKDSFRVSSTAMPGPLLIGQAWQKSLLKPGDYLSFKTELIELHKHRAPCNLI